MSIVIGSTIYFANIKSDYKWAMVQDTLVFGYQKSDRVEFCVVFWDTKQNKKNIK